MKIFPTIVMALIGTIAVLPFLATFFGTGVVKTPSLGSSQNAKCNVGQKDKYGRCPYSGSSGFRTFSTGGTSGTGSFGGSK